MVEVAILAYLALVLSICLNSINNSIQKLTKAIEGPEHVVELKATPEQCCEREGHVMYNVYQLDNFDIGGRSYWGLNKCSRCGHEEPWQYDM